MTRTALLALTAWALMLCAPVDAGYADTTTTSVTAANTTLQTPSPGSVPASGARLTRLARRLAATDDAGRTQPGTQDADISTDTTTGAARPGRTPLLTGTSLLRRGSGDTDDVAERPGIMSWMLKTLTALGVVIGLALLARFGYSRLGGKVAAASSPVVEVLSRTTVAPRSHVMLLRVGARVLVVSESSAGMRTLASMDDAQEVADLLGAVSAAKPTSISRSFNQLFNRFDEDYGPLSAEHDAGDARDRRLGRARDSVSGLLSRMRGLGRGGGAP